MFQILHIFVAIVFYTGNGFHYNCRVNLYEKLFAALGAFNASVFSNLIAIFSLMLEGQLQLSLVKLQFSD